MTGIDRLRDFAQHMKDFSVWPGGQKLLDIADQIERENIEDTEAAAWVREHGGLDSVKREWRSRVPYDKHEQRRQRLLGHIAECETALGRRNQRIKELGRHINDLTRENAELRRRAMPEGMEWLVEAWPRFEDDAPLRFGDEVPTLGMVNKIILFPDGSFSLQDGWACHHYKHGERIKRPATKVLDADGAEIRVGDTVWATNGHGPFEVTRTVYADRLRVICDDEKNGHLNVFPESITHRAPVLAADGEPLREGETVWSIEDGGPYKVDAPLSVDCYGVRLLNGRTPFRRSPDTLTHERPVLDADGVPIKVGDTVYFTDGREQECNTVVHAEYDCKDEPYVQLGRLNDVGYPTYTNCSCIDPSQLTHTKPEPPDSWERLEEDVSALVDENLECTVSMQDYVDERGVKCPHGILYLGVVQDVLRRAKALTERGR